MGSDFVREREANANAGGAGLFLDTLHCCPLPLALLCCGLPLISFSATNSNSIGFRRPAFLLCLDILE